MSKAKKIDFEKSMAELEAIVNAMDAGDMSLEQSLSAFEKGMTLSAQCQQALNDAELKVQVLLEKNGELQSEDFRAEDE